MSSRRKAVPPLRLSETNFNKNILLNNNANQLEFNDPSTSLNNIKNIKITNKDLINDNINETEICNKNIEKIKLNQNKKNKTINILKRVFDDEIITLNDDNDEKSINDTKKLRTYSLSNENEKV